MLTPRRRIYSYGLLLFSATAGAQAPGPPSPSPTLPPKDPPPSRSCWAGMATTTSSGPCGPLTCINPLSCSPGSVTTAAPVSRLPYTITYNCTATVLEAKSCPGCPICAPSPTLTTPPCESGYQTVPTPRLCPTLSCTGPSSCGTCYLSTRPLLDFPPFNEPNASTKDCTVHTTIGERCRGCPTCIPLPC
jgi:hypothetical protein